MYLRQTPRLQTVGPGVGMGGKQLLSNFPSFYFMGVTEPSSTPNPGNYKKTSPAPSQDTYEFLTGSASFPAFRSWGTGQMVRSDVKVVEEVSVTMGTYSSTSSACFLPDLQDKEGFCLEKARDN